MYFVLHTTVSQEVVIVILLLFLLISITEDGTTRKLYNKVVPKRNYDSVWETKEEEHQDTKTVFNTVNLDLFALGPKLNNRRLNRHVDRRHSAQPTTNTPVKDGGYLGFPSQP